MMAKHGQRTSRWLSEGADREPQQLDLHYYFFAGFSDFSPFFPDFFERSGEN
jgi:hypothetical protein